MAENFRTERNFPVIKNFGVTDTWTEVLLPSKAKIITIGSEDDIYVSFEGIEGGAYTNTNKMFIKADGYMALNLGRGTNQHNSIYICSKSSSADITIIFEEN